MLNAFTDFLRRQFDNYRTDAVAVYSFRGMPTESFRKDLTALFQDKKEIIYREFDNFSEIPSKRLTDVKTHFLLFPGGYGRIANLWESLPPFRGQNLIVVIIGSKKELFKDLRLSEIEQMEEILEFENRQLSYLHQGNIYNIGIDVLLYCYGKGFNANNYKQRISRFAGPVSPDNSGEAIKNEDVQVSFENKRQKIDPDEKGKELMLSIPSKSETKEATDPSEDFDANRKRKMSQR